MKLDKHVELPAYGGNSALIYNLPIAETFTGEVLIWFVPKAYSPDGWFVSCTPDGDRAEFPAVSLAEAHVVMRMCFKKDDAGEDDSQRPSKVDPYSLETSVESWKADVEAIRKQLLSQVNG
jgi:hypothetical protein